MATMISEVYAAFREAKVSDETARKAAEALAAYENRFASFQLGQERIEGRLNLITWMLGAIGAVIAGVGAPSVWLLLRLAAKVG